MKRVLLILATLGILCFAGSQAQANGYHGHGGYYYGGHHGYHHGPVVVRSPWVAPPVIVRVPAYPPVYAPRCYYPGPSYGFYYQGRGLSIGVGF